MQIEGARISGETTSQIERPPDRLQAWLPWTRPVPAQMWLDLGLRSFGLLSLEKGLSLSLLAPPVAQIVFSFFADNKYF